MRSRRHSRRRSSARRRRSASPRCSRNIRPLTPPRNRMPIAIVAITMKAPMSGSASSSTPTTAIAIAIGKTAWTKFSFTSMLAHHVVGRVHRDRELGQLGRLEVHDAERDPAARAVDALADAGNQHDDQQQQRGDEDPRRELLPDRDRHLHRDQRGERRRCRSNSRWRDRKWSAVARELGLSGIAIEAPNRPSRGRARAARRRPRRACGRSRAGAPAGRASTLIHSRTGIASAPARAGARDPRPAGAPSAARAARARPGMRQRALGASCGAHLAVPSAPRACTAATNTSARCA